MRALGREIRGEVGLNQTLLARLPPAGVEPLTELDQVALIDVPHTLEAE